MEESPNKGEGASASTATDKGEQPVLSAQPKQPDNVQTGDTKAEQQLKSKKTGYAPIKEEYLDLNHKRKIASAFLPKTAVEEIEQMNAHNDARKKDDGQGNGEPPKKRMKLKGRNKGKKRPREARPDHSKRLCPSVLRESECKFGDKCKFLHDVKEYFSTKKEALDQPCYLFDTYGKCEYGVTCRFAKSHLTPEFTNVVNEELYEKMKDRKKTRNILQKNTQIALWKRKYNFKIANNTVIALDDRYKNCKNRISENNQAERNDAEGFDEKGLPLDMNDIDEEEKQRLELAKKMEPKSAPVGVNKTQNFLGKLDSFMSGIGVHAKAKTSGTPTPSNNGKSDRLSPTVESEGSTSKPIPNSSESEGHIPKPAAGSGDHKHIPREGDSIGVKIESIEAKADNTVGTAAFTALKPLEKKKVNFVDKLYLAPLTTVGNLPFRAVCKKLGADITCSEMAVCSSLLQGSQSEWALVKRHPSEDLFGVQVCGAYPDQLTKCAQLLTETMDMDFIDINSGCPIDMIFKRGEGCGLMNRTHKFETIVKSMTTVMDVPLTVKIRTGIKEGQNSAHLLVPKLCSWGVAMTTIHGRTREQRYTRLADWDYISRCARLANPMPVFGNGDILSYEDYNTALGNSGVAGCMIARGALIKPWMFTEIKEQRHWDISANERLDILRDFSHFGLEHWGSDLQGVENTRRFLLEWLSFLYRYIPVGLLERVPQKINEKPPYYFGRNDLETLLGSPNSDDWVRISEMLLGPVPDGFTFLPKHKANAYT